ncbi:MAG: His/Gly/Thr/Pro-type tRNA ligase C-terminal domain-containing protein, partial [Streptosporangiaceae bacterium]
AQATVTLLSTRDEAARAAATTLYQGLLAAGVDTFLDDREERPGVKFKDAELTGIPFRLTVGSRDLADGLIEITSRASGEKDRVAVTDAVAHLTAVLRR